MKENRSLAGIIAVALVIGVAAYVIASQGDFTMGRGMGQHQGVRSRLC